VATKDKQSGSGKTNDKLDWPKLVPALARGVKILDIVANSNQSLNVTNLAEQLGVAKSSAHGLCVTLVSLNLLVRKSDQTYQLGPHVMRWANKFTREFDIAREFTTIWDEGSQLPGATITLSVIEGAEVVYIAARNSELGNIYNFRIGMRLPAPFTATGKAFLSYLSEYELRDLLGDRFPEPLTSYSVQNYTDLFSELKLYRERGYSVDNQQVREGMICFGASVLDSNNRPVAGVAVSLPKESVEEKEKNQIVGSVQEIAKKMSLRLGAEL
jgi:DNA-binding IclR family transcriptional regulator